KGSKLGKAGRYAFTRVSAGLSALISCAMQRDCYPGLVTVAFFRKSEDSYVYSLYCSSGLVYLSFLVVQFMSRFEFRTYSKSLDGKVKRRSVWFRFWHQAAEAFDQYGRDDKHDACIIEHRENQ
ncbi:MAG: hypothetical protein MN733_06970, partial [Nitrososphaera sp.]|nr:hypothetical protein [Nitrososphaera sp.]